MDVLAVRDAVARAVKRAREGGGPFILEVKTYRYRGHSMSDPAKYRTKEEVDEVKKTRDPIDHIKMLLADAKATEDEIKAIDAEIKAIVAEAVQFAQESPEPDPSELYTDVYVEACPVTDILMPALSPTMEEGTLTKWHIKAGDTVKAGDVIAEIETDKATMEVEAVDEGEVLEILVAEGSENVKVNTPIARLAGEDGAAAPASEGRGCGRG